jgi:hypothetical protein
MLTIRADQLEMFERIQFQKMQGRIECAIAHVFPDACADPSSADRPAAPRQPNQCGKNAVEKGIEAGIGLGLEHPADLAAFVALDIALRSAMVAPPDWIAAWLNRPDTPGTVKLAAIESRLAQLGVHDPLLQALAGQVGKARMAGAL